MASRWHAAAVELRRRLPRGAGGPLVKCIIWTIIAPGHLDKIAGLHYRACMGYDHELHGQTIMFDEPIPLDEVPSPWREALAANA